jgi:hypothetical protein
LGGSVVYFNFSWWGETESTWYVGHCLGGNVNSMKKDTRALIGPSKEVGLKVKAEKTKYMLMSRHQNAGKYHNIKIANGSSENLVSSDIWERQ